jgi:hypothetical protein
MSTELHNDILDLILDSDNDKYDEHDNESHITHNIENYISIRHRANRGKLRKYGKYINGKFVRYDKSVVDTYFSIKNKIKYALNINVSKKKLVESISFSGGGYNCAYHLGILKYLFKHKGSSIIDYDNLKFLGASGGSGIALIACIYLNRSNRMEILDRIIDELIKIEEKNVQMHEQVKLYSDILLTYVNPSDIDTLNDRLYISLTDVTNYIPQNHLVSQYENIDYLIDILQASACVPVLLDNKIRNVNGRTYMDGGFTNNIPCLNRDTTVKISCIKYPFVSADIVHNTILPDMYTCFVHPGKEHVMKLIDTGYNDFKDYIKKQMS